MFHKSGNIIGLLPLYICRSNWNFKWECNFYTYYSLYAETSTNV